jgi:cytochrome c-type biogenesis protein CcmF
MLAEVGYFLLGLSLAVALYAAFAAFWGIQQSDSRWASSARNGAYATAGLLALAFLILIAAFMSDQFQIDYVGHHSSRALPPYLKLSAVWAGQEGSLLLWAFLQALFTALVVARPSERTQPLIPWATVFMNVVTAFFVGVTLFLSNPFVQSAAAALNGVGLNPLLRHPGMIFHPPALFLGYVGLAVPFAFALAAMITGRIKDWPAATRRWTLAAWLFLGIGLLLGARWAYDVLGWGGYWGWDPVENAGLLPWFTATALLHGAVMQEQRGGFRVWNVLLAVLSFALVLFGTFTTRSGLIQSVHSFARSNLGPYFLAGIGITLFGSLALMIARRSILADSRPVEKFISRDGMFFLTLVLLLGLTTSVFIGSILPTITEVISGQRFEAGPEWFDRVTGPQFAALVLVMGVCPLLGRAAAAMRRLGNRGLPALVGAILLTIVAALLGFTGPVSLVGFAVIGLAGTTVLVEYGWDVAARSRSAQENPLQALLTLFGRNRRKYGGYLVHAGVILIALGVVGTRMYPVEEELVLAAGEPATIQDYTLVFEELQQEPADDHFSTWATLSVYRGGNYLGTLHPQLDQYVNFEQTVSVPALRVGLREDLYLVLAGWTGNGETATFKAHVNSLASFLWLGGLVFLVGGAVALWPAAREAREPTRAARRWPVGATVGMAVGVLTLIAAVVAMWGGDPTAIARPETANPETESRPPRGQPAPDFTLGLLDGSTLTLSELRGQVTVINFWATWCPPCEDEMPDLQTAWAEYQADGVTFVGIAYDDETAAVQEMIARFNVTYPQGMDVNGDIAAAYGITGVPETFIVDQRGNVTEIYIGPVSADELRRALDNVLGK